MTLHLAGLVLTLVNSQPSYESLSDGERYLYHQLSRKLDQVEGKVEENSTAQAGLTLRVNSLEIYSESLREANKAHQGRIEELEKFREYLTGQRMAEMSGIALLSGLAMSLFNTFVTRRIRERMDTRREE